MSLQICHSLNCLPYFLTKLRIINTFNSDVLPGVLQHFNELATNNKYKQGNLLCGLVTGNVEGIARKKMRAVGISKTNVFSPKSTDQTFVGENKDAFLGGFGSCYCYGDIKDRTRLYKDRGEQIMICIERAKSCLEDHQQLVRVVHVGMILFRIFHSLSSHRYLFDLIVIVYLRIYW